MRYYPAFLDLNRAPCCVIGGGPVACRKAKTLIDCGASVTVVSPQVVKAFKPLIRRGKVRWIRRVFRKKDVRAARLVIAATNDPAANLEIASICRRQKQWVNVVDQPKEGSFIVPSSVRRGKLTLAVSTGGVDPALAKRIRIDLEKRYAKLGRKL
ncbi:MAG: bifunctional precorrin-2 dehydrogenase/sirohydrochlorin ferrochelatase [Candidatus Omnitrophica bacterium]|nr:bifunctional precorrin-2 dehydrogenase/sirohydrochlorin ferrochelatase [Candidatus Omnitrophota bacterium]